MAYIMKEEISRKTFVLLFIILLAALAGTIIILDDIQKVRENGRLGASSFSSEQDKQVGLINIGIEKPSAELQGYE